MNDVAAVNTAQAPSGTAALQRTEESVEIIREVRSNTEQAVAQTVKRQADFSSNRAETLNRQAEQLESRVESRSAGEGLGNRLDISV